MSDDNRRDEDIRWFWRIVDAAAHSRDRLRTILYGLSKSDVRKFQDLFLDLATELQDLPYSRWLDAEESEDGLEDVAYRVVSQGRAEYEAVLARPDLMPSHIDVGDPAVLFGIADEVYYDRFAEPMGLM